MNQAVTKEAQRRIAVEHLQRNPDEYVRQFFNLEPDPHQITALKAVAKPNARVCIVGANGMGKDACVSWLPSWFLYMFGNIKGREALVPTTSASGRQIDTLWREINGWMAPSKNASAFEPLNRELRLKWIKGDDGKLVDGMHNKAIGFKALSQQVMESFHAPHLLYIMTEARACEDWAYLSMFKACTGDDNRIVIQSVPGAENGKFYEIATGKVKGWDVFFWPAARKVWFCPMCDTAQDYQLSGGTCVECRVDLKSKYVPTSARVTDASIQEKLAFGEDSEFFQAPVLANFIPGSSLALISLREYLDAEDRYGELKEELPDILGCDIAWTGQNNTVLCHRKGPVVYKLHRWNGQRTDYTADRIMEWLVAYPHGIACIESGIAQSGVIDQIIKANFGTRLQLVNPGGPPVGGEHEEQLFHDRRSQLYYFLQQRFKRGTIAIAEAGLPLREQLTGIKAKVRTDLKFQIAPKAEILKEMPSPDDADALMLTMAGTNEYGKAPTIEDILACGDMPTMGDWHF